MDAYISHFLHIPFPEDLTDEVWSIKWAQLKFLADAGVLGQQMKEALK